MKLLRNFDADTVIVMKKKEVWLVPVSVLRQLFSRVRAFYHIALLPQYSQYLLAKCGN